MTPGSAIAWLAAIVAAWFVTRKGVAYATPFSEQNRGVGVAVFTITLLGIAAVLAPIFAPFDPFAHPDPIGGRFLPPSATHLFGTDSFSRDVFSRTVTGARYSLAVALIATVVSLTVGTVWGGLAALKGGVIDRLLMRLVDAFMSVPRILVLMAVAATFRELSVVAVALLIGATGWFGTARLVRAQVRSALAEDYVLAAHSMGVGTARLLTVHLLPNITATLAVAATLGVAHAIVLEAGITWLGVGVQPDVPSWGRIVRDGMDTPGEQWWLWLFPGAAMVATVMAFNTIGNALRDTAGRGQLVQANQHTAR